MNHGTHDGHLNAPYTRDEDARFMARVSNQLTAPGVAQRALEDAVKAVGWASRDADNWHQAAFAATTFEARGSGNNGKKARQGDVENRKGPESGKLTDDKDPAHPAFKAACLASHSRASHNNCSHQYKGVDWLADRGLYRASIYHAGSLRQIGIFPDDVSAARGYDLAALRLQSEGKVGGAPILNFPDAQYTQADMSSMQATALQQEVQHSNYMGVSVVKHTGKWKAYINHSGGKHHLGCYNCEVDAAKAYDDGIKQLQKQGVLKRARKLNFPEDGVKGTVTVQAKRHKQEQLQQQEQQQQEKENAQQQQQEQKKRPSVYVGVHRHTTSRYWYARIHHNGSIHHLGNFKTEEEAARCYDAAVLRMIAEGKLAASVRSINFPEASYSQETIMSAEVPIDRVKQVIDSQYRGVSWDKLSQKWAAQMGMNGEMEQLGLFDSEEHAAAAYDHAVLQAVAKGKTKKNGRLNFVWSEGLAETTKKY